MSDELLGCPFCGGMAEIVTNRSPSPGWPYGAKAQCTNCHTFCLGLTVDAAEDGAAAAWNRRAPIAVTEAMVNAANIAYHSLPWNISVNSQEDIHWTRLRAALEAAMKALAP